MGARTAFNFTVGLRSRSASLSARSALSATLGCCDELSTPLTRLCIASLLCSSPPCALLYTASCPSSSSSSPVAAAMAQFKDREELDSSLRAANDTLQNELTARLVEAMTETCFKACVTQPSDYLTNKEERCMQVARSYTHPHTSHTPLHTSAHLRSTSICSPLRVCAGVQRQVPLLSSAHRGAVRSAPPPPLSSACIGFRPPPLSSLTLTLCLLVRCAVDAVSRQRLSEVSKDAVETLHRFVGASQAL